MTSYGYRYPMRLCTTSHHCSLLYITSCCTALQLDCSCTAAQRCDATRRDATRCVAQADIQRCYVLSRVRNSLIEMICSPLVRKCKRGSPLSLMQHSSPSPRPVDLPVLMNITYASAKTGKLPDTRMQTQTEQKQKLSKKQNATKHIVLCPISLLTLWISEGLTQA